MKLRVSGARELVPNTCNRDNKFGSTGFVLKLLAKAENVDIDRASKGSRVVTPDRTQKLGSRDGRSWTFHEVTQELKFSSGQVDRLAITRELLSGDVYLN